MTKLAVVADIHGNRWALEAVWTDLEARAVERVLNLGDSLYGPLDPAGTARLLMDRPGAWHVAGNQDRLLGDQAAPQSATLAWVREQLAPEHLSWLAGLPAALRLPEGVHACHGSPGDDTRYLLEDVGTGRVRLRSAPDLERDLAGLAAAGAEVVCCGHSHLPGVVQVGGVLVVNPGSVGLPAYADDEPPHAMAAGSPHARYALLEAGADGWRCSLVTLPYDWEAAAAAARAQERADWAQWLTSGRA